MKQLAPTALGTCLLLALWGWALPTRAAAPVDSTPGPINYFVQTWQEDEGLPRNTLTGISQTPDGYLWLATYFGLVRFDGIRFTTFAVEVLPELVNSHMWLLQTDQAGRLWMGTGTGGVMIYERGTFRVLDQRHGLPRPTVNSLCEDRAGVMWVSTGDGSISRILNGTKIEKIGLLRGQNSEVAILMTRDLGGTIWFAQGDSYGQLRNGLATNVTRVPGSLVHLCPSRDGGMWVSANRKLQKLATSPDSPPSLARTLPFGNYQIRSLCEDRQGTLWIGTRQQGLYQLRQGELHCVVPTSKTVREIYEDAEGSLWVAAEGEGLRRIRPRVFQVVDSHQGLPHDQVQAVCEGQNGDVWLAPQLGGLSRYSAAGLVETLPATTNLIVTSVLPDGKGGVWAGTVAAGLLHHDGVQMERSLKDTPFRERQIRVLFPAPKGQLWVSLFPSGLTRFGGDQLIWPAIYRGLGIPAQAIWAMTEDRLGGLWVGMIDGRVFRLQDNKVVSYQRTEGLPGIAIGALYMDPTGVLWVGTLGGGLGCLRDGKFKFASVQEGLRDNVISQIVEDDSGFMWFGSSRGIFRVRKRSLSEFMAGRQNRFESTPYGKSDGLVNVECKGGYQPSVWKTQAGQLWFATSKGAIHFDPAALPLNTNPPPLALEQVLVKGNAVVLGDPLELDWDHGNIEFDYTALSFIAPEKVRFRRQLVGFDPDWVEAGGSRSAIYPQLAPGRYEFRFTACNNDEVWNEQPCKQALVVTPAWWQTLWWRLAMIALFAAVVAGLARYYSTVAMRRRLARLEQAHAVEKERTRIARDIHDDVGARLTQMAYLSDLVATELPEGAHSGHLHEIARASRRTVQALDEIVWAVNPRKDSLAHLLEYISQYANNFFRGTNIRCRQDLPATVPDWPLPAEFRHHIFLAAKEALNNIQKHSRATEVWIRVAFRPPRLELIIEDNGAGFTMPEAKLSRDGLQNMHDRLATLNGVCDIASEAGRGTRLTMSVSLPQIDPANQKEP